MPYLWMVAALVVGVCMTGTLHAGTDVDRLRWQSRVFLVFAPGGGDPALRAQREMLAAARDGVLERDVAVIEVVGDGEPALRRRFRVPEGAFAAILVGKDGGEKLRAPRPVPAAELFGLIDGMPMRRHEARTR